MVLASIGTETGIVMATEDFRNHPVQCFGFLAAQENTWGAFKQYQCQGRGVSEIPRGIPTSSQGAEALPHPGTLFYR